MSPRPRCSPAAGTTAPWSCPTARTRTTLPVVEVDTSTELTWYRDIAPIFREKCLGCHVEGEIAPVQLETYEQVYSLRELIRHDVEEREMPPWDADPCCGKEYAYDRSMSDEQISTVVSWIEQGAPEGDPANLAEPYEAEPLDGLSRVDVTLTMEEPYEPEPSVGDSDEIRCFLLDWPETETRYVSGFHFVPGNRAIVHHVIAFVVADRYTGQLEAADEADPGPGWDCYGGLDVPTAGSLGGWVPGQAGVDFPEGLGHEVKPNMKVVLNMHYDLSATGFGVTDQSSIEIKLDDEVDQEVMTVVAGNPLWFFGDGMKIEGGDASATYAFRWDPTKVYGVQGFDIHNVNVHMHEAGVAANVAILRDGEDPECLLAAPEWDFDWQGEVWFAEPVRFDRGDELYVECTWDNSADNPNAYYESELRSGRARRPLPDAGDRVPIHDDGEGSGNQPDDMGWGADQEMCGALLMATPIGGWRE